MLPDTNAALIVLAIDEPAVTDLLPELPSEKSKEDVAIIIVNDALACALGLKPLLNPIALTTALLATGKAPA